MARLTRGGGPSVLGRGDLATSLLFVFPLLVAYELGVAFAPAGNGVDFITQWMFAAVGEDRTHYIVLNLALAGAFVALVLYLRRRRALALGDFTPMLLLSAIYALSMGSFIVFVMDRLLGFDGLMAIDAGTALIISLGAGVHEELVFRLGLLAGGAYLLRLLGVRHRWAVVLALAASALLFAAAHHVGPGGEPWNPVVFTYRALAGAVFGTIFYVHSLAHAVYTHFLYDAYVLIVRTG